MALGFLVLAFVTTLWIGFTNNGKFIYKTEYFHWEESDDILNTWNGDGN